MAICVFLFIPHKAHAAFTLTGSATATGAAGVAIPISDVQITGSGSEPIPVKIYSTSGTLTMSTTTGLTFDGATSGSVIYFSGTQSNINTALATLSYTRSGTGSDTIELSLVERGEVFFTDNNHLYKFISGSITATAARTAAAGLTAYGSTGYLATITSAAENSFVASRLQGDGWMGAGDIDTEGDWKWLTGPEAGTSFWSGAAGGSAVGGAYSNWSTGEPNDYNNGVPGEDCAQFYLATGKWNDLPCTGSTLSGYVAEFGAPGDLPTVPAKNIAITTVSALTANTLSPADNATNVNQSANLQITFNRAVQNGTGNIVIKKSSDNSIIETIDITSDQVTGQGTTTLTINPSVTLAENTEYYVTIASTAIKDTYTIAYAGINSTTAWSFTTGDFTGPTITSITATATSNTSETITWTTNESASTQVRYGPSSSYGTTTTKTDTSPRVTSHSVAITGLLACTKYHFTVSSEDSSSNSTTSSDNNFITSGCSGDTTPSDITVNSVPASSGGSTSLSQNNNQITVNAPSNFTDDASTVVIQVKALNKTSALQTIGRPTNSPYDGGGVVFDVKAIINGTTEVDTFDAPVTITYMYTDADIEGLKEDSLMLYHYHNNAWEALTNCTHTMNTNTISCTTTSFSIFGLFGEAIPQRVPLSKAHAPKCNDRKPDHEPDLFQIDFIGNKATLHFAPLPEHVTNYFIAYGYESGDERFGVLTGQGASSGVLTYTINDLEKDSTYYFRIRAQNGCMPGNWGNEMHGQTTNGSTVKTYYKNVVSQLYAAIPKQSSEVTTQSVLGTKTNRCSYTVRSGDSLWRVALDELGDGSRYTEIMQKNMITSTLLYPGDILQLPC